MNPGEAKNIELKSEMDNVWQCLSMSFRIELSSRQYKVEKQIFKKSSFKSRTISKIDYKKWVDFDNVLLIKPVKRNQLEIRIKKVKKKVNHTKKWKISS